MTELNNPTQCPDKAISAEEFRARAYRVIEIPGFEPGELMPVQVRRIGLTTLVKTGQLPNSLLPMVYETVQKGITPETLKGDDVNLFFQMVDGVVKACLVEPAYDDVAEVLSDDQKMAIFLYSQRGMKALESFRDQPEFTAEDGGSGEGIRAETVGSAGS